MHPDLSLEEVQILIAASQARAGEISARLGDASRLLDRRLMAIGPDGLAFILPAGTNELKRRELIR